MKKWRIHIPPLEYTYNYEGSSALFFNCFQNFFLWEGVKILELVSKLSPDNLGAVTIFFACLFKDVIPCLFIIISTSWFPMIIFSTLS